jgi:hypothetical protein
MPDYEIRFFDADGALAVVHISTHDTDDEAHAHARRIQAEHARYEIRRGSGESSSARR